LRTGLAPLLGPIATPGASKFGCAGAKSRHGQAAIEDVDYRTPRRLDKALFQQLAAGKWIAEHRNLLVTGPCGVRIIGVGCGQSYEIS
jgi:IstB-like ATP binding protein